MSGSEILVFFAIIYFAFSGLGKFYSAIKNVWPASRNIHERNLLGITPLISLVIIVYVLVSLASFDVKDIWIIFYVLLGYTWIFLGLKAMTKYFDLSWRDDAIELNNRAALFSIVGGILGLTAIYSGANIGDGPGWWCVVFAGSLGLITWFIVSIMINKVTNIFERVTVERDQAAGIRLGAFLLASGIILGRAAAGDWTSFSATIYEFKDGWPVLLLALLMIMVEKYYISVETKYSKTNIGLYGSIMWGLIYLAIAITSIYLLPPLKENPMYDLGQVIRGLSF